MPNPTRPLSTYRLQFTPTFTFDDAAAIMPYLSQLGITELYCAPIFRAKPGSTHGYDVCDFSQLNPELGGREGFDRLQTVMRAHQIGLVQDFVPNHMAVEPVLNPWWRSMLEHGPASPYASFFDVDWNPIKPELRGRVLLPFLGDYYGAVLERGELQIEYTPAGFVVRYFDLTRPIDARAYPQILRIGLVEPTSDEGDASDFGELLSIITAVEHIPAATDYSPETATMRLRESRIANERIARLVEVSPAVRAHIDTALSIVNGNPNSPESFDRLHALLESLPFRLAYWKTAIHEINYRRFFDINTLAGLRVEVPAAFQAMHQLLLELVAEGAVTGIRLDHIDGLFDPAGYAHDLQHAIQTACGGKADHGCYVVVEKILTGDELLPAWPTDGTTGYDFLNDVSRVFVDTKNAAPMRRLHRAFTGWTDPFRDVVYDCKKLITWTSLASELNVLADALDRLSEADRRTRDFTLDSLREALREVAVCFPVYRTYVGPQGATDADRQVIDQAIHRARRRNPAMEASVFDFVKSNLLPQRDGVPDEVFQARLRFAMKFQQYTGPLQAKGVEDTAFYRYNVLASLNEVGGDPQRFGSTVAQYHQTNLIRASQSPRGMNTTATHDTKRGEDARARIHTLSEMPRIWRKRVNDWAEINAGCRTTVDGSDAPDRNDEYLFYQALVGSWPSNVSEPIAPPEFIARMRDYMQKAIKEAKTHTSWITANDAYDAATTKFVEDVLSGPRSREFLKRFLPIQQRAARLGIVNSLGQVVLKAIAPGVPDFYQGSERWELSLVDPDNRRPVDYELHAKMLAELEPWIANASPPTPTPDTVGGWLRQSTDGRIKMYLIACLLRLRRREPALFLAGDYLPLVVEGDKSDHLIACARHHEGKWALAVVPRLCAKIAKGRRLPLGEIWGETAIRLPADFGAGACESIFTHTTHTPDGDRLRVADLFAHCPVAMLSRTN